MKNLLTIAGSDCSGGAGIQADLKTFAAHQTYGMSVITAVTAQNTQGVFAVQNVNTDIIARQIDAIFSDIHVDAVKIGMLSNKEVISVVAEKLQLFLPKIIVLDPVMVSKSGYHLLEGDAYQFLIKKLFPLTFFLTPNIPEAEIICDMKIFDKDTMQIAAKKIFEMGTKNVLLKGGHLQNSADDLLFDGKNFEWFCGVKISNKNTHGTGCSLSSALAANLANGQDVFTAVQNAKNYVTLGIKNGLNIGKGFGPIHHFVELFKKAD